MGKTRRERDCNKKHHKPRPLPGKRRGGNFYSRIIVDHTGKEVVLILCSKTDREGEERGGEQRTDLCLSHDANDAERVESTFLFEQK